MSTLSAIQIQGIRSFGPDNPQRIKFFTPLTLIVGQNGCGKTTIIECLKYITSGELPPGSGKGGSFVHDPKLAMETDVRGQIKLSFNSTKKDNIIVSRSLQTTQKAKKLEFKTLDAIIRRTNPDGSKTDISGKCIDFEREMISLLAVSKPILDNVIFCHQEDSSWPLDEGKRVKEKFDAIFNATKYIKCLDNIKKVRKSLQTDARTAQEVLHVLKTIKMEADNKHKDLVMQEEKLSGMKDKKQKVQDDMIPIAERIREIRKIEHRLSEIKLEIMTKRGKLESLRNAQSELRAGQNEQIKCSDMELRRMIQDFQRNVEDKERELRKVESSLQEVMRNMKSNLRQLKEVQDSKTNLEFAYKNHVTRMKQRNQKLEVIVNEYTFAEFNGVLEFDDAKAKLVLSQLEDYINNNQQKIFSKKKDFEKEEREIQAEIDSFQKKEAALEQEVRSKGKQREDLKARGRTVRMKLEENEMEFSASSLEEIKTQLTKVEKDIKEHEGQFNLDRARREIEEIKKSKNDVEFKLDEKKRLVHKMNRQAQTRSKLDIHVQEKENLEKNIQFYKRKHKDEFEHLFNEIPEENMKYKLEACITSLKQRSLELRMEKEGLNKRKTTLDTMVDNMTKDLRRKEEEVRGVEEKIETVCEGQELSRALSRSKEQKELLTKEQGDLSSSITVLKRFIDRLTQDDCCPLCHRDFTRRDEVELLIEELNDKIQKFPTKLNDTKVKLEKQEILYDQMVGLKPLQDQANKTRELLEKKRAEIESSRKEIEKINGDLEANSEVLDITAADEETARSLQNDVVTMDNHLKKIKQLNDDIEDLKSSLGSTDGEISMEEAMKQQNELEEEIKILRKKESDWQERLDEYKRELEALKDRRLKLSTKELDMRTKLQETETLKEELKKLDKDSAKVEEELDKAKEEVAPFRFRIQIKNGEKTKKTNEKEKWIEEENSKLQIVRDNQKNANILHTDILNYVGSGKEELLIKSRQQLERLEETSHTLESQKQTLEEDQRQLEKDLSNQKERKRNLDDERKIRDKEEEAKKLQGEIEDVEASIKDSNEETVLEEKCQLTAKYEKLHSESSNIDGSSKIIAEEIRKLKVDLQKDEFRNADKKYKTKFYERKSLQVAVDDLDKYYKALDTAIMHFHSGKMKLINTIIRELWRTTYKGNDIDYIEIKTDETESQGADKRRVYHYRVVMMKNNTEMDMRSRCSAGQKVLASLIIRLALAETFSANCGILALDEPTTNLDSANVEALAVALLNIVEKRKSQKNFQLIVITHDFEFLQKLAMRDHMDYYYKVSRNERGLSMIKKHNAETLC